MMLSLSWTAISEQLQHERDKAHQVHLIDIIMNGDIIGLTTAKIGWGENIMNKVMNGETMVDDHVQQIIMYQQWKNGQIYSTYGQVQKHIDI